MRRYTFTYHPVEYLVHNKDQIISGLVKTVGIYLNAKGQLTGLIAENQKVSALSITENEITSKINKDRSKGAGSEWLSEEQLPFIIQRHQRKQLRINDEFDNKILLLRLKRDESHDCDLLYLYFNDNTGNFGISLSDTKLSALNKKIISKSIYGSISLLVSGLCSDYKLNNTLNYSRAVADERVVLISKELEKLKIHHSESVKRYAMYILQKLATEEQLNLSISKGAINKLTNDTTNLAEVETMIEQAVTIAFNRSIGSRSSLEINENDLLEPNYNASIPVEEIYDRFAKTKNFLDKYEKSATLVVQKELPLTGVNIGKNCSPPCSPAAISDILRKYGKRMLSLLDRYPDSWTTIRSGFKPVVNLESKQKRHVA